MKYFLLILVSLVTLSARIKAQEQKSSPSLTLDGYLSFMPSLYNAGDSSLWQVVLHNRMNINGYISDNFNFSVQFRNQIIAGDFVKLMNAENGFKKENYFLPFTYKNTFGEEYLISSAIDRLWVQYTHNNLEIKLGRQRINWGQTFVWNPNDIFNTYNFFDFDYPERPGADAIRIQYYTSNTSSLDLALKIDSSGYPTGAGMYRFTKWNTEFQVLAGYYSKANKLVISDTLPAFKWDTKDLAAGFGLSAGVGTVSIRSEMSYLFSVLENNDSTNQFLASLTVDYTLGSNTSMMFEFFYNSKVQLSGSSFFGLYEGSQDVKTLSFTRYNIFGQVTYPILPILNGTLAGMYFFDNDFTGFYAGPTADLSLEDNLTLTAVFQLFYYKLNNPYTGQDEWFNSNFIFLRLKWNF